MAFKTKHPTHQTTYNNTNKKDMHRTKKNHDFFFSLMLTLRNRKNPDRSGPARIFPDRVRIFRTG